jgi:hypothetical protein
MDDLTPNQNKNQHAIVGGLEGKCVWDPSFINALINAQKY